MTPIRASGERAPFFCVPGINGNPLALYQLAVALGEDQPFWCLEPLRPEDHARPLSVSEIAARYVAEIRMQQPHGPYFLGGFSAGGAFAYEMACQLEAVGERVEVLALFGAFNPGFGRTLPKYRLAFFYLRFFAHRFLRAFHELAKLRGKERLLLLETLRRNFGKQLQRMNAKVENTPSKVLASMQQVSDFYGQAYQSYQPGRYAGRVTLFRASVAEVEPFGDSFLGWLPVAAGGIDVRVISGDHVSMMRSGELAGALKDLLAGCRDHQRTG